MSRLFPRTFFYTSAINDKNIFKAEELMADVAVLDLEDSVPENEKNNARSSVGRFLDSTNFTPIRAIRINSIRTKYGIDDLHFILNLNSYPNILVMPMVNDPEEIIIVKNIFINYNSNIKVYPTIETGHALNKINHISAVADGLIFGSADYAAQLGVDITWENMLYARYQIVSNAAAYNIPAIDTACYNLSSNDVLIQECKLARMLGFSGKAAVHPSQVKFINEQFSFSEEELDYAKKVVTEFEDNQQKIKKFNGQMIGPPFAAKARKVLKRNYGIS